MRVFLLFPAHALLSFALALSADDSGRPITKDHVGEVVDLVTTVQVVTAGLLVWLTSRTDRFTAWLLGVPAAAWAIWCGFIASMAFSGVWL